MATPRFYLPPPLKGTGKNQPLIDATNMLEEQAKKYRRPLRVGWRYDLWWLRGIRKFRVMWSTGEVGVTYQNDRGELQIRYEDVLVKRQRELGRLMQIDVRPAVKPKGTGLDALRKSSIAQVILDYLESQLNGEEIKGALIQNLVDFGTGGLGVWVQDSVHLGASPTIEVIPPWELLFIPTEPSSSNDINGVVRDRWVSFDWLKSIKSLRLADGADGEAQMMIRTLGPGGRLPGDADPTHTNTVGATAGTHKETQQAAANDNKQKTYTKWAYLREYWIQGEYDRVARYIVKVGDWIALDVEFPQAGDTECPVMPVSIARYYDTGAYGRSFVSPLVPINRQQEKMVGNLFQNIIDLDLYGLKLLPTTAGIKRDALKNWGRLRYLFVEPDWNAPGRVTVDSLTPTNMGDFPAKIIEMSHGMMDRLSRESDLWSGNAPGRVDNSKTIGILYETSSIPMVPVTSSISNAYARVYKAMLQEAAKMLKSPEASNTIKLLTLDDAIAGVVIDPATGQMRLDDSNPIPSPSEVTLDVRERLPKFKEKDRQELQEQYMAMGPKGSMDMNFVDYLVEMLRRGIDIPAGNRGKVENIRTAWLENLILFGDGITPGTILQNEEYDDHMIHLQILTDFMARPEWRLASDAVRAKFLIHKQFHMMALGSWPATVPNPENLAMMDPNLQMGLEQGASAGPPMGTPPPM